MFIFLFILLAGLALIYINVSAVAKGKVGKLIALAVLLLIFVGMFLRSTLVGSCIVAFFAVWLCQSLIFYIPWTLYRIGYYFTQPHHLSHRKVRRVSRYLLGISVSITLLFFGFGMPHNDDYRINLLTVKLPSQYTESFSAIFFSDIHIDPIFNREKLERFIAQADSIKPDYLLFGGDLADVSTEKLDRWGYDTLFKKLTATAKISAVAINGNHEAMITSENSSPEDWMRKVGFVVLDDSTACLGVACFTGRTDFHVARRRDQERKPLAELIPDSTYRPWILMDHQPKGIEKGHSGRLPEFALSGHTHNGQFFPGTVIIDWVWKVAYGKGALGGVYWLVSSGFDCWGPPVRVGSDSEIWVIKFKAQEKPVDSSQEETPEAN